jgi:hypothetical protein
MTFSSSLDHALSERVDEVGERIDECAAGGEDIVGFQCAEGSSLASWSISSTLAMSSGSVTSCVVSSESVASVCVSLPVPEVR